MSSFVFRAPLVVWRRGSLVLPVIMLLLMGHESLAIEKTKLRRSSSSYSSFFSSSLDLSMSSTDDADVAQQPQQLPLQLQLQPPPPLPSSDYHSQKHQNSVVDDDDDEGEIIFLKRQLMLSLDCPLADIEFQPFTIDLDIGSAVPLEECDAKMISSVIQKTILTKGLAGSDEISYGALMCPIVDAPSSTDADAAAGAESDAATADPTADSDADSDAANATATAADAATDDDDDDDDDDDEEVDDRRLEESLSEWDVINRWEDDASPTMTHESKKNYYHRRLRRHRHSSGGGHCGYCQPKDSDCNTPGCRRRRRLGRRLNIVSFDPPVDIVTNSSIDASGGPDGNANATTNVAAVAGGEETTTGTASLTEEELLAIVESSVKLLIEVDLETTLALELREHVECYDNDDTLTIDVTVTAVSSIPPSSFACLFHQHSGAADRD